MNQFTVPGFAGDDYEEDDAELIARHWPNIFDAPEMTLTMAIGHSLNDWPESEMAGKQEVLPMAA